MARTKAVLGTGARLSDYLSASLLAQAADETSLLQRRDQAVHPRLGLQVERLTHLVETWADPGFAEAIMDEVQQFMLFGGQHRPISVTFHWEQRRNV